MKQVNYATASEIQRSGIEALCRGIGVVGLIRFMQHFDKGQGDYTADRQEWQKEYSVDSLLKAMQSERRE
jgi:hypothetical protein